MKKVFLLFVGLALAFSLFACGGSSTPPAPSQAALDALQQAAAAVNPTEPGTVLLAHFAARNAFDVDAALGYVDPQAVFSSQKETASDSAAVRKFIQDRVNEGFNYTISDLVVSGDNLAFVVAVTKGGQDIAQLDGKATVVNGKITKLDMLE
jgi:hypothetical protein